MQVSSFLQLLSISAAFAAAAPSPRHGHGRVTSSSSQEPSSTPSANNDVSSSAAVVAQPAVTSSAASNAGSSGSSGSNSTSGMVFAHYMLITRPPSNDYATDMIAAKAMGIDAFAVNYGGVNTNYDQQNAWLTEFYGKAAANGMKAFLSIDTTIGITPDKIVNLTKTFATHPAQLQIDGQPLLTSFELGPPTAWNWKTDVLSKVSPTPMFLGCSLSASGSNTLSMENQQGSVGSITWLQPTLSPEEQKALDSSTSQHKANNKWIAAVAPWYFKRLAADQNWAHAQDDAIFVDRFTNLLTLDPRPDFIEITTWNDWGEGHYIGYADDKSECEACYYAKLNHTGFQRLAKPFIQAFKSGATKPVVEDEEVFMFYRTQKASINDNSGWPLPVNASSLKDEVFVVGALKQPATVTVTTGPTTATVSLAAGVQKTGIPFAFGAQKLSGSIGGQAFSKTGPSINETVVKVNDGIVII